MDYVFHLVHGTWPDGFPPLLRLRNWLRFRRPRRLRWSDVASPFSQGIRSYFQDKAITIEEVQWSGSNTFTARRAASVMLRRHLRNSQRRFQHAKHIIIAHSHGGNVAVNSLRRLDPAYHPDAVIAMATPFLCVERVGATTPAERLIARAASAFALWCLVLLSAAALSAIPLLALELVGLSGPWRSWGRNGVLVLASLVAAFFIGRFLLLARGKRRRWFRRAAKMAGAEAEGNLEQSPTRFLVVRASGDEATLALALFALSTAISQGLWKLCRSLVAFVILASQLLAMLSLIPFMAIQRIGTHLANNSRGALRAIGCLLTAIALIGMSLSCIFLLTGAPVIVSYSEAIQDLPEWPSTKSPLTAIATAGNTFSIANIAWWVLLGAFLLLPLVRALLFLCFVGPEAIVLSTRYAVYAEVAPPGLMVDALYLRLPISWRFLRHAIYEHAEIQVQLAKWITRQAANGLKDRSVT